MPQMSNASSRRSGPKNVVSRGRYLVAAFFFLMLRLSLVTTIGLVGWLFFKFETADRMVLTLLGVSIAVLAVSGLHVMLNGRRVTCPLCKASLFMSTKNLVKPGVPKVLGCAKTPLAFSLLTMPTVMRCPCCAERVRLVRSS